MAEALTALGEGMMAGPIVNLNDLSFSEIGKGGRYLASRAPVSPRIGASKLGYSVIKLAPGKTAWPCHAHYVIEEMFFVLNGRGTLRHADKEYAIKQGDFICSPADSRQAHQIINSSDEELAYIALSTQEPADVTLYPDSGKYGVWVGQSEDPNGPDSFQLTARKESAVDYWDGEDG